MENYHSYSFVLLGWYRKLPETNRLITILRYFWITFYLFLMVLVMALFLYQLVLEMLNPESTMKSIIPNLRWSSNYPLYFTSAFVFLIRRKELLNFFHDWDLMERQLLPSTNKQRKEYRRLYICVYVFYACHGISNLLRTTTVLINQPGAPFFLSYYKVLRETLTLPVLMIFQETTFVVGWIFVLLADLVPAWIFCHAGFALQSIGNALLSCSKNSVKRTISIRQLRFQYEMVNKLTERLNQVFGGLMMLNHITLFSTICAMSYNILKTFKGPDGDTINFSLATTFYVLRLTIPILMTSHLHTSSFKLRSTLSAAISNETILDSEENHRAILLLNRMNQNPLAARPLDLYNINPTILMTMTSLIISNVIVLIQSN